jgi:DNA-directed RNA polymerase specialized sigma24 family protein
VSDETNISTDVGGFEELFHDRIVPHEGLTVTQVELQLRMSHVLKQMPDEEVDLLQRRYAGLETLEEIASDLGVSRQAATGRVETALQNLRRAFAEHWNDPVDLEGLGA